MLHVAICNLFLAVLPGCELFQKKGAAPARAAFDYAALAARYNARIDRVEQLYARGVVELEWIDAKGKKRFEQGDANLMMRRPTDLGLSIGKFSETMFWLGSDASRYWWIEVKAPEGEEPTAYVGDHAGAAAAEVRGPLPVGPMQLYALLGLSRLAGPQEAHAEPTPEVIDDWRRVWVARPLGGAKGGGPTELTLIDVERALPLAVRIIDAEGVEIVSTKLEEYERMTIEGAPPGAWPAVPTRIELLAPQRSARMTLFINDPGDGKARGKIKDAQFDFEKLVRLLGVQRVRLLDHEDR